MVQLFFFLIRVIWLNYVAWETKYFDTNNNWDITLDSDKTTKP